ncbi:fimbrial protein [Enterobacter asburiae]|uniref:fimbrial protein n=1 Tax=Enterobacter asburiae TaxID=61645 RepID=UPI00159EDBCA|nr:type 1 fimbrial protein [Enterobacter asburiae]MDE4034263.1 type 1 fimbrial protein [Enterobacter asburiae]MDE4066924.1 type 1 fimbrial protein [Enterobacter asburiae]MDE4070724.1 type 1 fimbrial protein [Enterobacter asburiae]
MNFWKKSLLMVSLMIAASAVFAADPVNLDINISGTVVANGSCTFGQEETVVDFKEVDFAEENGVTSLSGAYRKPLSAVMTCSGDSGGKAQMTFSAVDGITLDFGGHKLLPVSINDSNAGHELGIRLLVNGLVQDVNVPFAVDMLMQPAIQAELVLVGNGDGLISGAKISASATLVMEFV